MFVLLSMGIADDIAFVVPITIDATEDSGQYLSEEAYPRSVDIDNIPHPVSADTADWNLKSDFGSFATAKNIAYWSEIESAGNIWSFDQLLGDSLSGFPGTYRITLLDGTFERDSFNWSNWRERLWEIHVEAANETTDNIFVASPNDSSNGGYDASEDAFTTVSGYYYHDLDTAEGGSFNFSIADLNSNDNFGYLAFPFAKIPKPATIESAKIPEPVTTEFAKIPEPTTILLLGLGLMGITGIRRFIK